MEPDFCIYVKIGVSKHPVRKQFRYYGEIESKNRAIQNAIEYVWGFIGSDWDPWPYISEVNPDGKKKTEDTSIRATHWQNANIPMFAVSSNTSF